MSPETKLAIDVYRQSCDAKMKAELAEARSNELSLLVPKEEIGIWLEETQKIEEEFSELLDAKLGVIKRRQERQLRKVLADKTEKMINLLR